MFCSILLKAVCQQILYIKTVSLHKCQMNITLGLQLTQVIGCRIASHLCA